MLDYAAVLERLHAAIRAAGSQQAFARQHRISEQYISDVRHGRRIVGDKILAAIGLERVVQYREAVDTVVDTQGTPLRVTDTRSDK